jgi:hypothetical protein
MYTAFFGKDGSLASMFAVCVVDVRRNRDASARRRLSLVVDR